MWCSKVFWQLQWGEVIQSLSSIQLVQKMKKVWWLGERDLCWHHFCECLKLISAPHMWVWGTLLRSSGLGTTKLLCGATAGFPYLWTWGQRLPAPWSRSAAGLCKWQQSNPLPGEPETESVCHHAQGNRNLTWENTFFSPSPVISGQTHWEKLALNWSPGAHSCHKPSREEQCGKFSMFMRELGGSSAS